MSGYERGEVSHYEVTWRTGHVETVLAHSITWPGQGMHLGRHGLSFGGLLTETAEPPRTRIHFHAEIDGRWCLTLAADEEDILSIRLVTTPEPIPGGAS